MKTIVIEILRKDRIDFNLSDMKSKYKDVEWYGIIATKLGFGTLILTNGKQVRITILLNQSIP